MNKSSQIRSYNASEYISEISLGLAKKYFEQLKDEINVSDIDDNDLLLYSAWIVSQEILRQETNYFALYQADEYARSQEQVEKYGTKGRAYNNGYDSYVRDHTMGGDSYLERIVEIYEEELNSKQQK